MPGDQANKIAQAASKPVTNIKDTKGVPTFQSQVRITTTAIPDVSKQLSQQFALPVNKSTPIPQNTQTSVAAPSQTAAQFVETERRRIAEAEKVKSEQERKGIPASIKQSNSGRDTSNNGSVFVVQLKSINGNTSSRGSAPKNNTLPDEISQAHTPEQPRPTNSRPIIAEAARRQQLAETAKRQQLAEKEAQEQARLKALVQAEYEQQIANADQKTEPTGTGALANRKRQEVQTAAHQYAAKSPVLTPVNSQMRPAPPADNTNRSFSPKKQQSERSVTQEHHASSTTSHVTLNSPPIIQHSHTPNILNLDGWIPVSTDSSTNSVTSEELPEGKQVGGHPENAKSLADSPPKALATKEKKPSSRQTPVKQVASSSLTTEDRWGQQVPSKPTGKANGESHQEQKNKPEPDIAEGSAARNLLTVFEASATTTHAATTNTSSPPPSGYPRLDPRFSTVSPDITESSNSLQHLDSLIAEATAAMKSTPASIVPTDNKAAQTAFTTPIPIPHNIPKAPAKNTITIDELLAQNADTSKDDGQQLSAIAINQSLTTAPAPTDRHKESESRKPIKTPVKNNDPRQEQADMPQTRIVQEDSALVSRIKHNPVPRNNSDVDVNDDQKSDTAPETVLTSHRRPAPSTPNKAGRKSTTKISTPLRELPPKTPVKSSSNAQDTQNESKVGSSQKNRSTSLPDLDAPPTDRASTPPSEISVNTTNAEQPLEQKNIINNNDTKIPDTTIPLPPKLSQSQDRPRRIASMLSRVSTQFTSLRNTSHKDLKKFSYENPMYQRKAPAYLKASLCVTATLGVASTTAAVMTMADNANLRAEIDLKLSEAKSYADTKDTKTLESAQSYADTKDTATLASAQSYADAGDSSTLNAAKSYADTGDQALQTQRNADTTAQAATDAIQNANITARPTTESVAAEIATAKQAAIDAAAAAAAGIYATKTEFNNQVTTQVVKDTAQDTSVINLQNTQTSQTSTLTSTQYASAIPTLASTKTMTPVNTAPLFNSSTGIMTAITSLIISGTLPDTTKQAFTIEIDMPAPTSGTAFAMDASSTGWTFVSTASNIKTYTTSSSLSLQTLLQGDLTAFKNALGTFVISRSDCSSTTTGIAQTVISAIRLNISGTQYTLMQQTATTPLPTAKFGSTAQLKASGAGTANCRRLLKSPLFLHPYEAASYLPTEGHCEPYGEITAAIGSDGQCYAIDPRQEYADDTLITVKDTQTQKEQQITYKDLQSLLHSAETIATEAIQDRRLSEIRQETLASVEIKEEPGILVRFASATLPTAMTAALATLIGDIVVVPLMEKLQATQYAHTEKIRIVSQMATFFAARALIAYYFNPHIALDSLLHQAVESIGLNFAGQYVWQQAQQAGEKLFASKLSVLPTHAAPQTSPTSRYTQIITPIGIIVATTGLSFAYEALKGTVSGSPQAIAADILLQFGYTIANTAICTFSTEATRQGVIPVATRFLNSLYSGLCNLASPAAKSTENTL